MAYGFEARVLMFEAIRGSTCQPTSKGKKPPQLVFLVDQCVFSSGLFRPARAAKVGKGIGDHLPNTEPE